jgi:hypothetical protein|tara:strand:- start:14108 stop:14329 length:222 start_codon:yes stop_codon:yes gene_type:complete
MQWVIDVWCKDDRRLSKLVNKKTKQNRIDPEHTKLKFCPNCKYVWEKEYGDYIVKYVDFPSIGLKRKCCKYCK